jgi:hydroxyacylglutathione hydrolase
MRVDVLVSTLSDNRFYLVHDEQSGILVDPYDVATAVDAVRSRGLQTVVIVATHGHWDHVGGNAEASEALGCEVIVPRDEREFLIVGDRQVGDGDRVEVGALCLDVLHLPGHTGGHIALRGPDFLVSGDVLFYGGVGNCRFGGDPGELYRTVCDRLAAVPDNTRIFPGHDYAARNLDFIVSIEPDNEEARHLRSVIEPVNGGGLNVPVLGVERRYNPFHRVRDPRLQAKLAASHASRWDEGVADLGERAFRLLRSLRDEF